jgi:hypothetical protein
VAKSVQRSFRLSARTHLSALMADHPAEGALADQVRWLS